jgi:hypothetical protein
MGENQHNGGHPENKTNAAAQNQTRPRRQPEILIGSVFMQVCTFLWSHPIGGLSFTLAMLCFTLGPLASGINDARRTWWYAIGIWFFLGGIIYFVFDHEISKRMPATKTIPEPAASNISSGTHWLYPDGPPSPLTLRYLFDTDFHGYSMVSTEQPIKFPSSGAERKIPFHVLEDVNARSRFLAFFIRASKNSPSNYGAAANKSSHSRAS